MRNGGANGNGNGIYTENQFDAFYQNHSNNGYDHDWAFTGAGLDPTLNSGIQQPMNLYSNWQLSTAPPSHIDPYGRSFSKSPSFQQPQQQQHQQQPYDFGNARQYQQSPFDPSLAAQTHLGQQYGAVQQPFATQRQGGNTVAPQALEATRQQPQQHTINPQQSYLHTAKTSLAVQPASATPSTVDQLQLISAIPKGTIDGRFHILDYAQLSAATDSKRMNVFVNVGQHDFEYPINRAALPTPSQRKSRTELRRLAADDPKLLAKLGKKVPKKAAGLNKAPKETTRIIKSVVTPAGVKHEVQSPSDYSSSEEDSSDYESEDEQPFPLPSKRPDDNPLEAVKYDATKALWRGGRYIASSEIRAGLKDYWEVVRTIRDRWKADAAAVVEAEEKNRKGEVPLLKSRVKDQLNMIEVAFKAALEHGHKSILELSAENVPFVFLCYQFLLDRHKANDLDGPLVKAILGLLAVCSTLTEEKLTKTHLVKVLPRFSKKGSDEIAALVRKIEAAAKEGTRKKNNEEKIATEDAASPKDVGSPKTDTTTGVKRAAPSGTVNGQPSKRIASSSLNNVTTASPTEKAVNKPAAVTVAKVAQKPATGTAVTTQPLKTKTVASKPSSMFSGAQAAPKKPAATTPSSTKPAVSSVVASTLKNLDDKSKKTIVAAAASVKPAFSFADTMANLGKPKEEKRPTPKMDQESVNETEEQKKKRLRKESRRHLRVSFKPESTLEEVRFFTHDPDEEFGHDASMMRDVSDVGGEGRMFKQHKDNVDVDEEDDGPGEEEVRPYTEPSAIDFAEVDKDERERNYEQFGGGEQKVESAEVPLREQYEMETLMAVYTAREDIPPSPKEAPETSEPDNEPVKEFGEPGGVAAERAARLRAAKTTPAPPQKAQPQQQMPSGSTDIAAILAALTPQNQQQSAAPQPAPTQTQDQMSAIQNIMANFQQSAPPQAAAPPAQQAAPQNALPANLASLFANLQAQGGQPAPASTPAPAPVAQAPQAPDLAALFASLGQGAAAPAAPPNMQGFGSNGFPSLPFDFGNNAPPPQSQGYPYENEERKRWRETSDEGGRGQEKKKKGGFHDKRFTQPCKFWQQGKCQKGDKCTYLHT
ncbi:hypothetical protein MBLNU457_7617t1 [Dothideomycetes sp. NU457]